MESARELRALGAIVATVVCVIDRDAGGAANLAAEGLELRPLLDLDALRTASAERPGR